MGAGIVPHPTARQNGLAHGWMAAACAQRAAFSPSVGPPWHTLAAMARKAPTLPAAAVWGHRAPEPLRPLPEEPAAHAALYAFLRAGGGDADITHRFSRPDPDVRACVARYLDDPAAFDAGDATWNEALVVSLDPTQKRAYKRSHAAAAKAQSARAWGLFHATRAARDVPELRARVLTGFAHASSRARFEIARSFFADDAPVDAEVLSTLSALVDDPVTHDTVAAMALGVRACLGLDPARALQQLAPRLAMPEAATPDAMPRSIGIVLGLRATPRLDPAWAEVLRPLLADMTLACHAVYVLEKFDLDATWRASLLGHILRDPRSPNVFDLPALRLLVRVANTDALPVFARALQIHNAAVPIALEGLCRVGGPEALALVEAWIARHEAEGVDATWEPLARAHVARTALGG